MIQTELKWLKESDPYASLSCQNLLWYIEFSIARCEEKDF